MKATSRTDFWQFFEARTAILENEGRWGTAANYAKTGRSFRRYYGDGLLRFRDITSDLIEGYNRCLYETGLIRNSVSQYNRVLRAVYNEAVREGLVRDRRPFCNVYTGIDKTEKRAIREEELAKIASASPSSSSLEMARDLFLFSYASCGMPFDLN